MCLYLYVYVCICEGVFLVEKPENHYPMGRFSHRSNWLLRSIYYYLRKAQLHTLKKKIIKKENWEVFITLLIWKVMHGWNEC